MSDSVQKTDNYLKTLGKMKELLTRCKYFVEQVSKRLKIDMEVNTEDTEACSQFQPELLENCTLKPYQITGVKWLLHLYENAMNAILGDEMGLGKTVQTIALIAEFISGGVEGPFLISAPLSTIDNWYHEFQRFAPKIPVILCHGTRDERKFFEGLINISGKAGNFNCYPVVIMSYGTIMTDKKVLQKTHWSYIVLDEGHRIKNFNCKLFGILQEYKRDNALLLTGTPLQNNLSELWSLLHFMLPELFDDVEMFNDLTTLTLSNNDEDIVMQEERDHIISYIHQMLTPFLLRRTKADVNIDLPMKKEVIIYVQMSPTQELYYKYILDKASLLGKKISLCGSADVENPKYKKFKKNNTGEESLSNEKGSHSTVNKKHKDNCHSTNSDSIDLANSSLDIKIKNMNNVLVLLREVCLHPDIINYYHDTHFSGVPASTENILKSSAKMAILDVMLQKLKEQNHKVLIFTQMIGMLDILEDYCHLKNFEYSRLDGRLSLNDRVTEIQRFNSSDSVFIFLLSSRAGGLGINLTAADTVILYDSDWNPQIDIQAQDRCHRIGQDKPVIVYRLVLAGTVDEYVYETAVRKLKLQKLVLQEGRFTTSDTLNRCHKDITSDELRALLCTVNSKNLLKIDSSSFMEQINMLLDRSDMYERSFNNTCPMNIGAL